MPGTAGKVGLVFVSHSSKIAEGLVELAGQMAGGTSLVAAGGTDDGGIGTSFDRVSAAVTEADSGLGVVVLCDLGSAILTAETAMDFLDEEVQSRVRIVDAPLVEGGVAAAVAAESGGSLDEVVAAAESAAGTATDAVQTPPTDARGTDARGPDAGSRPEEAAIVAVAATTASATASRTVSIVNKDGLHARPAAEFVKLASSFPVRVTVNGKDAKSLLGIMSMGLTKGARVEIASTDPDAVEAVNALADLVESGFGEA